MKCKYFESIQDTEAGRIVPLKRLTKEDFRGTSGDGENHRISALKAKGTLKKINSCESFTITHFLFKQYF